MRVRRAEPGDRHGDVIGRHREARAAAYRRWLGAHAAGARSSPDGTRRPYWLLRPLKPAREVYALPPA